MVKRYSDAATRDAPNGPSTEPFASLTAQGLKGVATWDGTATPNREDFVAGYFVAGMAQILSTPPRTGWHAPLHPVKGYEARVIIANAI
jgi:hypothetical protein